MSKIRMHFSVILEGEETMSHKFMNAITTNPSIHVDLARGLCQSVILALRLGHDDNINIVDFKAGVMPEPQVPAESPPADPQVFKAEIEEKS